MMHDDELMHFGVKGMQWGVRKDTASSKRSARALARGKNLYGEDYDGKKMKVALNKEEVFNNKDALQAYLQKVNLAKQYNKLIDEVNAESKSKAKEFLDRGLKMLEKSVEQAAQQQLNKAVSAAMDKKITEFTAKMAAYKLKKAAK